MTAASAAGAVSRDSVDWQAIDWQAVHANVRRLQARIVKATQEGRWGKVAALQRLLTHSFSGKALAVRRVTENQGKRTPGVDGETWDTPTKKATAVRRLRQRGYRPQPLRRIYIPKKHGTMRPLGIPMCHAYCISIQAASRFTVERLATPPAASPFYIRGSHVTTVRGGSTAAVPACVTPRSPRASAAPTTGRAVRPACRPAAPTHTTPQSSRPTR
jgi:hypothetical protein